MTLLLMAAGRGSRYGALKQFDALGPNKEFLMEFSISDALNCGFDHIVLVTQESNVAYLKDYLTKRVPHHVKLDVIAQTVANLPKGTEVTMDREKPWGTAHAVWCAKNIMDGPFVVINADDYYGSTAFEKIVSAAINGIQENEFLLLAYELKQTLSEHGCVSRGICKVNDSKILESVQEYTKLEIVDNVVIDRETGCSFTGEELTSMNFWLCQPSIFTSIEHEIRSFIEKKENIKTGEVYLPLVIQKMVSSKKVKVKTVSADETWFGVTYRSDREMAVSALNKMTKRGLYPKPLW